MRYHKEIIQARDHYFVQADISVAELVFRILRNWR